MASKIIVDQLEKTGGTLTALTLPVANATANQYIKNDGAGALSWATLATGGLKSKIIYTSGTNWVKSVRGSDITKVIVEVQGGGGGGGYSGASDWAVAGSGGGYAMKLIDVSSVTQAVITVGLGGTAAGVSSVAGGDGGDSSWIDTAYGGSSTVTGVKGVGLYANYGRTAGGLGTGGDIHIQGGGGDICSTGASTAAPGRSVLGQAGMNGYSGQGGIVASQGYGAGGPAGYSVASLVGMPGLVVVWEFI
jgi:hypothetical protein